MSIAKAMRVMSAARKDTIDAINVTVMCEDKDKSRAMKMTPVADGGNLRLRI